MTTAPTQKTDLAKRISQIKAHLVDGATGALRAAPEVLVLVEEWDAKYRADADGQDVQTYLRGYLGPGRNVRFFQVRADAVKAFGLRSACLLHHDAAVWLHQRGLAKPELDKLLLKIGGEFKAQNSNPLTRQQLLRVFKAVMGALPRQPRRCVDCETFKATIAKLEAELREARAAKKAAA